MSSQKLLDGFTRYYSLLLEVRFVADQADSDLVVRVVFDLLQPVLQGVKGTPGSQVEDQKGSDRTSVVGSGDRPERLLAGGVPDLQFDLTVVNFDTASSELYSQGGLMLILEPIFKEPEQKATLADI